MQSHMRCLRYSEKTSKAFVKPSNWEVLKLAVFTPVILMWQFCKNVELRSSVWRDTKCLQEFGWTVLLRISISLQIGTLHFSLQVMFSSALINVCLLCQYTSFLEALLFSREFFGFNHHPHCHVLIVFFFNLLINAADGTLARSV